MIPKLNYGCVLVAVLLLTACGDKGAGEAGEASTRTPPALCGHILEVNNGIDALRKTLGGNCFEVLTALSKRLEPTQYAALATCITAASDLKSVAMCQPEWGEGGVPGEDKNPSISVRGPRANYKVEGDLANVVLRCPATEESPLGFKMESMGVTLGTPVTVTISSLPGATVSIDEVEFKIDDKGQATGQLDPMPWFARMEFEIKKMGGSRKRPMVWEQVKWSASVKVGYTPPDGDGAPLSVACVADPGGYFGSKFYGLKKGGVEYPWERGTPVPTAREGGWIETIKTKSSLGPVKHPGDVDVVAIVTSQGDRKQKCGPYVGGGKSVYKTVKLHDSAITVYERRTGKVLATEVRKAKRHACPKTTWSNEGLPGSYVKEKASLGELQAMVRKHLK